MIKAGRFFVNKEEQKQKKKIIIFIILGVLLLIFIVFKITSKIINKNNFSGNYEIKTDMTVEVNTPIPSFLSFFSKLENIPTDKINIAFDERFAYKPNFDNCSTEEKLKIMRINNRQEKYNSIKDIMCEQIIPTNTGTYNVYILIGDEGYQTKIEIVDTISPILKTKTVIKKTNQYYSAKDFVESCVDNSEYCNVEFVTANNGINYDFSSYKLPGTYTILLQAKDRNGNVSEIQQAILMIIE